MKNLTKKLLTGFLALSLSIQVMAQAPQKFNYQGIARDAQGNPLKNQKLALKLAVLPAQDASQAEFEETQLVTTNEFGLYTLQIGNGQVVTGDMKTVKWETGNKYIHVAIDPTGGSNYVDAGTTQLLSVPYALYSDRAGSATESAPSTRATNNYIEKTNGAGVANSTSLLYDNGTNIGLGITSPVAKLHINQNIAAVQEHLRMQNLSSTGAGRFTLYNDAPTAGYANFTKYGTAYPGGYAGIPALYPYANLLAFGNNGVVSGDGLGRFLITSSGNVGISLFKSGVSKLKFHADFTTENVGIGGSSAPISRIHANNTDGTTMDLRLTNNTTGHLVGDGLEIRNVGTLANITNKENNSLVFGTNNAERMRITPSGVLLSGSSNEFANTWYRANFYQPTIGQGSSIYLQTVDAGNTAFDGAQISLENGSNPSIGIYNRESGGIDFRTSGNYNSMKIADNGNVGIDAGTSPATKLHVKGFQETIRMEGSNSWFGIADDASSYDSWIWNNSANNQIVLGSLAKNYSIQPGGQEAMQLYADGKIGMGITNPRDNVTIQNERVAEANLAIRNSGAGTPGIKVLTIGTNSGFTFYGTTIGVNVGDTTGGVYRAVNASAFNIASDRRMKKEINTIHSAEYSNYLNQIRNIESATYRYNWEDATTRPYSHVGFISQTLPNEVTTIMDEQASAKSGEKRIGYNLSDMAGLTLLGVKAVDQKNTELETLIQTQQQRLDAQALLIEKLAKEIELLKSK